MTQFELIQNQLHELRVQLRAEREEYQKEIRNFQEQLEQLKSGRKRKRVELEVSSEDESTEDEFLGEEDHCESISKTSKFLKHVDSDLAIIDKEADNLLEEIEVHIYSKIERTHAILSDLSYVFPNVKTYVLLSCCNSYKISANYSRKCESVRQFFKSNFWFIPSIFYKKHIPLLFKDTNSAFKKPKIKNKMFIDFRQVIFQ